MFRIGPVPAPEGSNAMTASAAPHGTTSTLPPPSLNGSSPSPPPAAPAPQDERLSTRISGMRTGLIAAAVALTVVMIFIIQNAHAANISFLGVHLVLPLAAALIIAFAAGALLMAAAGTARITQLRLMMRRARQKLDAG
jgi:putative membrane protein